MKVALVSIPWCAFDSPSASIAALSAYVRLHEPSVSVHCLHEHRRVWARIPDWYETIQEHCWGLLFYVPVLFPSRRPEAREALSREARRISARGGRLSAIARRLLEAVDRLDEIVEQLDHHVEQLARSLSAEYVTTPRTDMDFMPHRLMWRFGSGMMGNERSPKLDLKMWTILEITDFRPIKSKRVGAS